MTEMMNEEQMNVEAEATAKPYKIGKLQANHLFLLMRVLNAAGVKDIVASVKDNVTVTGKRGKGVKAEEVGFDVVMQVVDVLMAKLPNCRAEIYAFLEAVSNLTAEQIGELDICTFMDMVVDVVKAPDFKDFFTRVSKLIN